MDGLSFSNHTPGPGLVELKKVIGTVRLFMEEEELFLENGYDFISLEHLAATYKIDWFDSRYVQVIVAESTHYTNLMKRQSIRFWRASNSTSKSWRAYQNFPPRSYPLAPESEECLSGQIISSSISNAVGPCFSRDSMVATDIVSIVNCPSIAIDPSGLQ